MTTTELCARCKQTLAVYLSASGWWFCNNCYSDEMRRTGNRRAPLDFADDEAYEDYHGLAHYAPNDKWV